MDSLFSAGMILVAILLILASGTWVFAGLVLVAASAMILIGDMSLARVTNILGSIVLRVATSWALSAIPLFVWMGEMILKTDLSVRVFRGLSPIMRFLPGGLIHSNVFGCALFSAICGSSAATTATVGKITIAELGRENYRRSLVLGSLAGSGSLGLLIPPSIVMIVYGVLAEVPVDRLFAAGILPGVFIAAVFSAYVGVNSLLYGERETDRTAAAAESLVAKNMPWKSLCDLFPILLLGGVVLGSIYSGLATPSEAAAVGVVAVLALTAATRSLSRRVFHESLMNALHASVMIFTVVIAASFMATALGYLHIPARLATFILESEISAGMFILLASILFLFLGMVLDGVSIIVMTLPILFPIVQKLGVDPIWFGIYLVIMVEIGQITPPIGFNLMIIHSISGTPISRVALYALPFCVLMCLSIVVFHLFPEIVLFLPNALFN